VPSPSSAAPRAGPGVPLALARWRERHYRAPRYELAFRLRPGARSVSGTLQLAVTIPRGPLDLVLDWRGGPVNGVRVNGRTASPLYKNQHLVIPRRALKRGRNLLQLAFSAPVRAGGPLRRYRDARDGAEYLYTLLVPADASALFPCFDQPGLKGRFRLKLDLPKNWRAVANAPALEERTGFARFAETPPISTYLFAFAAGPFRVVTRKSEPVRLFVRQSRLARARAVAPALLRLNRAAMDRFARDCGHPFPFPKYDLVLIPDFHYGGMEHAGATFLREDRVLLRQPRSRYWRRRRALLLLHETAHQWMGNLVTMRWFDDLWLKEGFANYLAYGALQALALEFDGERAWAELTSSGRRAAAKPGAPALHAPLDNLAAARSVYTEIVYRTAPAVLRHAEREFGAARFRRALRSFVRRHAWGAVDWRDLVRALERATGRDLRPWARRRILQPDALAQGVPPTRAMGIQ